MKRTSIAVLLLLIAASFAVCAYLIFHKAVSDTKEGSTTIEGNPSLVSTSSETTLIDTDQSSTEEQENETGSTQEASSPETEYHFGGTLESLVVDAGNETVFQTSQINSWYDAGLYSGYKGDIKLKKQECDIKLRGSYSLVATYDKTNDIYLCNSAILIIYD